MPQDLQKEKKMKEKKIVCLVYFDYIDFDIYILFICRLTRIYIKIIIACRQRWFENFENEWFMHQFQSLNISFVTKNRNAQNRNKAEKAIKIWNEKKTHNTYWWKRRRFYRRWLRLKCNILQKILCYWNSLVLAVGTTWMF